MPEIRVDTEGELIEELLQSAPYKEFKLKQLQLKVDREKQAWRLLQQNRTRLSKDVLNQVFDKVDYYEPNKRWFGALLATPNRNLIFASDPRLINQWFTTLLSQPIDPATALNTCLKKLKIKGASKGLATLILYLSSPNLYNIWVNATQEGLTILNRLPDLRSGDWGENYIRFNKAAVDFREKYSFQPQEIDWILSFVSSYVESQDDHFQVSEDILKTEKVPVTIDDEQDIDDIVGEPMELEVMRWSPTNEMGVVALFIEFRKDLGFPMIEVIRTRFPDAAVFEEAAKGYVRKYVEFEFRSSGYRAHLKSHRKCHYVVCWENDWKDCPIPVIELRREIPTILSRRAKIPAT